MITKELIKDLNESFKNDFIYKALLNNNKLNDTKAENGLMLALKEDSTLKQKNIIKVDF